VGLRDTDGQETWFLTFVRLNLGPGKGIRKDSRGLVLVGVRDKRLLGKTLGKRGMYCFGQEFFLFREFRDRCGGNPCCICHRPKGLTWPRGVDDARGHTSGGEREDVATGKSTYHTKKKAPSTKKT